MHHVRRRYMFSRVAIPVIAGPCALYGACPAQSQSLQVPTVTGYVNGGLSVSLSERALTDALQKHVLPALRDSLSAALDALPGATVESLLRAGGVPGPIPDTHGAAFDAVRWDPDTLRLQVDLVEPDTLRLAVQSGPLVFSMSAETCHGDCLIGCCMRSRARFEVRMQDVLVDLALTSDQLLHGAGESPGASFGQPNIDIRGLEVDFGTPHFGGVVGWLSGAALVAEVFNLFGVPRALLGALAGDTIVASIQEPLEDAILEQFPVMEFEGLASLGIAPDLPPSAPVRLDTRFADTPEIRGGEAIVVQVGTVFAPHDTRIDPAAYLPVQLAAILGAVDSSSAMVLGPDNDAARLDAVTLGGDVAIATTEDAVNQLFAALASSGATRAQFDGLRVGELVPGMSLPELGIGADTPVSIDIDAAREENGPRLAPHIEFLDDPATSDVLEARLRLRMTVRGILQRGQPIASDSTQCACFDHDPACVERPCVLSEGDVDLDLHIGARLEAVGDSLALLHVAVSEVLELAVVEPFTIPLAADSATAAVDSLPDTNDALEVVGSSKTSPVLALVRDRLNALSMPIPVPLDVLTLGGWMEVTNLRLFTTPEDSTTGVAGTLGILADLDADGDRVPLVAATASAAPGPVANDASLVTPSTASSPTATIRAGMPSTSTWLLTIYDSDGRPVRRLRGHGGPGFIDISWDGRGEDGRAVAEGDYVYHFETLGYEVSRRLQLGE